MFFLFKKVSGMFVPRKNSEFPKVTFCQYHTKNSTFLPKTLQKHSRSCSNKDEKVNAKLKAQNVRAKFQRNAQGFSEFFHGKLPKSVESTKGAFRAQETLHTLGYNVLCHWDDPRLRKKNQFESFIFFQSLWRHVKIPGISCTVPKKIRTGNFLALSGFVCYVENGIN